MSIALDAALFLREQKESKPLSLCERGLLFTLLFRVGSNPFAWVSQETLCTELDLADSNLRSQIKKISAKGYIEIMKDPKDKRKNLYRPAEFLINYHQISNRTATKKYRSKTGGNIRDTARKQAVNTARKQAVSLEKKTPQTPDSSNRERIQNSPKEKVNKNKSKAFVLKTQKKSSSASRNFYPSKSKNVKSAYASVDKQSTTYTPSPKGKKNRSPEAEAAWNVALQIAGVRRPTCK